ncbi:MAG TPA: isoprenylcysteine carboxylmethyltransferase family protein [Micromonosporaceae bacterium]
MAVRKLLVLGYSAVAYVAFVVSFAYTIGFLADVVVPKGVDDGPVGPACLAVVVDAALLGLFAVQHSVMARPWFKRWLTRVVAPAIERSTYVLASSLAVALLLWQWRPLPATVWSVSLDWLRFALWLLYGLGWVVLLFATIQIGHFDLFGIRQALARWRDRAYGEPEFRTPLLYRLVRHPIMLGFLIAFWATPEMSVGRLLFAGAATGYILVGVRFEEHDLRRELGAVYERYLTEVPGLVPRLPFRAGGSANAPAGPAAEPVRASRAQRRP